MADNLFELLNAPTSLKPKDLATHIRMQVSLPEETRNICSRDLFRMDIKLPNELTTCRYGRKLPKEDDPGYLAFCEAIAFKGVEPIPYRFFASEYAAVKAGAADYKKAVAAVAEPWRIQAYAAQYLRMAQNAETGKPESASQLWHTAVRYYKKFFAAAGVEESYSFQYAPDDDAREACRRAWNDFLKNQLEALIARRKDYISRQNTKAAEACLKVLSYKEVQAIVPDAYDQSVKESFAPYVAAIKSATDLDKAGEMYKNCPKTLRELDEDHELEIAMLTAIGAELNRRKAVKEPAKAVPVWLEKLEAKKLYGNGAVMVKIEAKSVYEACADYVRFALDSKDLDILQCACDICVADIFPDDVFIGKGSDGDLYRPGIAPILVGNLTEALAEKMLTKLTVTSAASFAQKIIPVCKKLGYNETAYAAIVGGANYMGSRNADKEILLAYLRKFDPKTPLKDPDCPTVEALIKKLEGNPGVKLLKELAGTNCSSSNYPGLVDKVLDYVKKHGDDRVEGERFEDVARKVLLQEFVGCANQCQSNPSDSLLRCLKKLAEFLKYSTPVPAGDKKMTVGDVMNRIQRDMLLKELVETSSTSPSYSGIVDKVLDYVKKHGDEKVDGEKSEILIRKVLLQVFVGCANQCQSKPSDSLLKCLKKLAEFLGYSTPVPAGEKKMTVGDVMKNLIPSPELECLKRLADAGTGSREENAAVDEVIRLAQAKGSMKIQGTTLLELVRKVLLNTYVSNANDYQTSHSSTSRDIMYTIAGFLPAKTMLPGGGNKTVRRFDNQIEPMQRLSEIQERIQNESFTENDIMCLSWYIENLPDFDLGGNSFRNVARKFLRAMLVTCANQVQSNDSYYSNEWRSMLGLLVGLGAFGSEVSKQEAEAVAKIIRHYNIDVTRARNTYSPLHTPLNESGSDEHVFVRFIAAVVLIILVLGLAAWGISSFMKKRSRASVGAAQKALEATAVMAVVPSDQSDDKTEAPTEAPDRKAADIATAKPTAAPTAEPTAAPTAEPTAAPTTEPTAAPTTEPTAAPTAEPTAAPTAEPTAAPTAEPTAAPTAEQAGGLTLEFSSEPGIEQILEALGEEVYRGTYQALQAGEVIQKGSKGETARGLQQTLIAFGQSIVADGDIGSKTLRALNDVQQAHGLEVTETMDAEGYALLLSALLDSRP